jgi:ribosomal protein S18 acetylase RimI-like enzyme
MKSEVLIRPLKPEDLEAIVEIDQKILGTRRPDFYAKKISKNSKKQNTIALVAEVEGKVVGFILGAISGWEFGVPSSFGWIDTVGVDPEFQGRGIGTFLFKNIVKEFSKLGIKRIYTLVSWDDWDLLAFFKKMGFRRGELINLEYEIKDSFLDTQDIPSDS